MCDRRECDIHGRVLGRYWRTSAEGAVCVEAVFFAYQVLLFLMVIEKGAVGTAPCEVQQLGHGQPALVSG